MLDIKLKYIIGIIALLLLNALVPGMFLAGILSFLFFRFFATIF